MLLKGAQCVVRYSSVFLCVLPDPMLSELTEGGVIGNWVVEFHSNIIVKL